jgi:hypothetical protein
MPVSECLELPMGLLDHLGTSVESLRERFSHLAPLEASTLLATAETLEDRFALALRLMPPKIAMSLCCDYAENALNLTEDLCSSPLEIDQHRRYREDVRTLRQCLAGERNDSNSVYASWPAYGEFYVCRAIAEAGADSGQAPRHCWKAAKWAREYYASRITRYSMSQRQRRIQKRYELCWQMEHARVVLLHVLCELHSLAGRSGLT